MKPWMKVYIQNGSLDRESEFSSMSFVELKKLARGRGIKFKAAIRKDELIVLLEEEEQQNLDYLDRVEEAERNE